jgi:hypothetical protein
VWVQAIERSQHMVRYSGELRVIQPPVDRRLQGTSAWINLLKRADDQTPSGVSWESSGTAGSTP